MKGDGCLSEIVVTSIVLTILATLASYIISTLKRVLKRTRPAKIAVKKKAYALREKPNFDDARESFKKGKISLEEYEEHLVNKMYFRRKVSEPPKITDSMKRPYYISLILIILVFITLLVFYMGDGMEGAKIAWSFGGPLMGAICGFWLSSKTEKYD